MDNTSAIAIGLTVGLFVVLVSLLLFFKLRKRRRVVSPLGVLPLHKGQSKSATSSSSSLRTPIPILQKSFSDSSSEKLKTQKKKTDKRSHEHLEIQAESMTISPTQKVSSRLTPSDSPGPPIGDQSPRSSQDLQRRDVVTPTSPHRPPQIHQPQPQHPQVLIEVDPTTEENPPYSYIVQRQPPIPLSDSPSPPPSPARSRSLDRPGYAPDEDNPGPYPPAQPAQRRGLSRSSRQRSPRVRGGRSSSSNS